MKNPWVKKNPFMSMWLSGANAIAGKVRGHATVQAKRAVSSAIKKNTRTMNNLWSDALTGGRAKKRKPR